MEVLIVNQKKISPLLILTIFLTCFGSSMLYGYNMAVINLPADKIKCFLNETILMVPCKEAYDNSNLNYNISTLNNSIHRKLDANFLYAQTSTVFVIAGIIGAFSSGWVADFFGRRNGLLMNHIFAIIGAIIIGMTVKTRNFALLYIGRFFIGINSGIAISLASMYLTEIAPRIYRGAIGACHQLAVTSGIVIGYLLTMTHTMNTESLWPIACASTAIPAIISLCFLPICPESPRFLFLKRFKEDLARKEFIRINKIEDVEIFLGELRNEVEISKNQPKFKYIRLFTQKDLRMPLIIACLIQVMQQISGINAVISYSGSMLESAGISQIYSQYCVIVIGILNVIGTIISLPLLEKCGRRTLLLWPSIIVGLCLLFLTITVNTVNSPGLLSLNSKRIIGGISVFLIMTYIIGFAFGLGTVPALIVAEIFRLEQRGAAYSISQAIQWVVNLLVLCSFPSMNKAIGGYSFLLYLVIVMFCWVFFFLYMPETKNRTVDDVAHDLAFGVSVIFKKKTQLLTHPVYDKISRNNEAVNIISTET